MNDKTLNLRVYDETEVSRRGLLDALEVGESIIFVAAPDQPLTNLQRGISGSYRGSQSMSSEGLKQERGLLVFEGEISLSVTRVTRVKRPPGNF